RERSAVRAVAEFEILRPRAAAGLVEGQQKIAEASRAEGELVIVAGRPCVRTEGMSAAVAGRRAVGGGGSVQGAGRGSGGVRLEAQFGGKRAGCGARSGD